MYMIPKPRSVEIAENGSKVKIPATVSGGEFIQAAKTLCGLANRFCSRKLSLGADGIRMIRDGSLAEGAYRLDIGEECVTVAASGESGAYNAVSTLLQILEPDGSIPAAKIEDCPQDSYSSVMVDLARVWHDFDMLKQYVDLCRFYKIKVLHLHFTDDQSYTLPSRLFPKLSTAGRSYSFSEIKELNEYARLRGVQIMPEIDVPGHCESFCEGYPDIFGTKNIIPINQRSMDAMRALFGELCDLFPYSKYIHIGGDEAVISKWIESEEDHGFYRSVGVDPNRDPEAASEELLAYFVNEMADAVFAKGRQPVAWEGFREEFNGRVRKDLIMISWENYYQTTPQLLKAGFRIINCSWQPLYVVAPRTFWRERDVFGWDLTLWTPVHNKSPYYGSHVRVDDCEQILGAGLCVWSDQLQKYYKDECPQGTRDEFELAAERLPALAENSWNRKKIRSFDDYLEARIGLKSKLKKILGEG